MSPGEWRDRSGKHEAAAVEGAEVGGQAGRELVGPQLERDRCGTPAIEYGEPGGEDVVSHPLAVKRGCERLVVLGDLRAPSVLDEGVVPEVRARGVGRVEIEEGRRVLVEPGQEGRDDGVVLDHAGRSQRQQAAEVADAAEIRAVLDSAGSYWMGFLRTAALGEGATV